ncbi:MAG: hypothetical protein NT157_01195 [Candidatus Micrarchaeota archaeon]|nr:hypothetical protein [Candidatus Micrarchaeota archaeon]
MGMGEGTIDIVAAILTAGMIINTTEHEEHVSTTLRYFEEFRKELKKMDFEE